MPEESPFRFYPLLFLTDVNVMRMEMQSSLGRQCRGIYITLLCHSWIEGELVDDEEVLKAICGDPKNWDEIWAIVSKCFKSKKGLLHNKRQEIERQKLIDWREKSRKGGIESGVIRGEKALKGGSRVVEPPLNGGSIKVNQKLEAYCILSKEFHDEQSGAYPKDSCFNNREKLDNEGAIQLERFVRINDWTFEEVEALLKWIAQDSWWSPRIKSLRSIRNRSENDSLKFENARASMLASPKHIEDAQEEEHLKSSQKEQNERRKGYQKDADEAATPDEAREGLRGDERAREILGDKN